MFPTRRECNVGEVVGELKVDCNLQVKLSSDIRVSIKVSNARGVSSENATYGNWLSRSVWAQGEIECCSRRCVEVDSVEKQADVHGAREVVLAI